MRERAAVAAKRGKLNILLYVYVCSKQTLMDKHTHTHTKAIMTSVFMSELQFFVASLSLSLTYINSSLYDPSFFILCA